jgi:hypothetical protein
MDEYNHFGLDLIEEGPVDPNQTLKLFSAVGKSSTSLWQLPKTQKVNFLSKSKYRAKMKTIWGYFSGFPTS